MSWIPFVSMLLLASAFVTVPLLRARSSSGSGVQEPATTLARALYRDRVAEIEAEVAAGRLDPEVREQVLGELGAVLLDDDRELQAIAGQPPAPPGAARARLLGWLLAVLVPLTGLGVYALVGEPSADRIAGAGVVLSLDPAADAASLAEWRARLEQRVESVPDDAQSWFLLGTIDLAQDDFSRAVKAFDRASAITGPDPVLDIYLLQARYLEAGGTLDAGMREIADRVLNEQPNQALVLELLAIDSYRVGAFRDAVTYLNRALTNDLRGAQLENLLAGLEASRAGMGVILPSVKVTVAAVGPVPRDAVLFVIARPVGGGMPLAVVRRPAARLPLSVQLDDTTSMNPAVTLSAASEFELVVRLSLAGTPAPAPGDWEWRSGPLGAADLAAPVDYEVILEPPGDR